MGTHMDVTRHMDTFDRHHCDVPGTCQTQLADISGLRPGGDAFLLLHKDEWTPAVDMSCALVKLISKNT